MKIALHLHHILLSLFICFSTLLFKTIHSANSINASQLSDYYNQCAPSTCGGSVVKFPFGPNPLCTTRYISATCENNSSIFLKPDDYPNIKYKLVQNLTNEIYVNASVKIVDTSLFGCGTIPPFNGSQPNSGYQAQEWNMDDQVSLFGVCKVRNLRRVLQEGFEIQWERTCNSCTENDVGRCGYVDDEKRTGTSTEYCFCKDGIHEDTCTGEVIDIGATGDGKEVIMIKPRKNKIGLIVGIGMAGAVFIFLCTWYISYKRKHKKQIRFRSTDDQELKCYLEGVSGAAPASIETFLHNYTLGRPTRFSYKQLKKYTNNFTQKIGQGGFGSVYKGQLPNGFTIAVKILDETTNQIETQFLNEVLTIGCIHHNHLVRLLGYCFDHSRIALIYEYLTNGSLDKYIHQKKHMNEGQSKNTSSPQHVPELVTLTWAQLLDIAIGTAKGLAYLHEECQNRILHLDIKPHNILLDAKFQPKVSDFGLAKALNKENSHISVTHPTGTPGYAPPEMWYVKLGQVTNKSDVYSFGMVVLEMAGTRRNFEDDASKTSEMYFPEWVFSHHVQNAYGNGGGSKWHECKGKEEEEMAMMLELVGLWCIQFEPSKRPSMRKVVDMLEGTLAIETPSSPFVTNLSTYGYGNECKIALELNTLSSFEKLEGNGTSAN